MTKNQKKKIAEIETENKKLALAKPFLKRNCELSFALVKLRLDFLEMIKEIDSVLDPE